MHTRQIRSFTLVAAAMLGSLTLSSRAAAQADPRADGLIASDYLRIGAGLTTPVNPQGSLRDWNNGAGVSVFYENWGQGGSGVGRVGFGLGVGYNRLPLNEQNLKQDFNPPLGGGTQSATASDAVILEITSMVRIRIPAPYIMPTVNIGFGYINWAPGEIHYVTNNGQAGSAKQQHRSGAEVSIGGGLDKSIYDRWAVFGEAMYTYGFTTFGQAFANSPGGVCPTNGCDILKNTTIGVVRGGVRVRLGR